MSDEQRHAGEQILERTRDEVKDPQLYKVILHNDDYTTMEFVVQILETIFNKSPAEAFRIMIHVHTRGQGLAGVYTHEVAETKVVTVQELAVQHGFPLRASMELE
jgi:ATP-dependent Clp protease adaptor protein ClpS